VAKSYSVIDDFIERLSWTHKESRFQMSGDAGWHLQVQKCVIASSETGLPILDFVATEVRKFLRL